LCSKLQDVNVEASISEGVNVTQGSEHALGTASIGIHGFALHHGKGPCFGVLLGSRREDHTNGTLRGVQLLQDAIDQLATGVMAHTPMYAMQESAHLPGSSGLMSSLI
jgi:hypothetical protein